MKKYEKQLYEKLASSRRRRGISSSIKSITLISQLESRNFGSNLR
jgi:hypothetical protein